MLVARPTRHRAVALARLRPSYAPVLAGAALAASMLTACFTGEDDPPGYQPPVTLSPCVDVPQAVRAQADGLVADGNRQMVDNFEFWFDQSDDWHEARVRSPQAALDKYDAALKVAPGHCQAVFGRAMASATMLTQDTRMDEFIRKVEDATTDEVDGTEGMEKRSARRASFAGLFKTSPEQAAPMLVKLSAGLEEVDPPTVKEAQDLIEQVIMPKLDSTIAALEVIMDYSMFAVRFDKDGDTLEIDRGEIGPGLAGLKVAKAWLTVVAGYNLDITPDGNYDWVRTLEDLDMEDYDHLTAAQTAALDHVTGLFKTSSPVTRMKAAWKDRINGIPDLLLSAVGDAQKGLESAIAEAKSGDPQAYDVWKAGSGEDADVDTVDLRNLITLLERSKKYLTGEVNVEYDRGLRHIKVNLTRLFHIDGAQKLLPYFKFYPYAQWNDTVSADTSWGSYFGYESWRGALAGAGYDPKLVDGSRTGDWYINISDSIASVSNGTVFAVTTVGKKIVARQWAYDTTFGTSTYRYVLLATLTTDSASPCKFNFDRVRQAEIDATGELVLSDDDGAGSFTLRGCREEAGEAVYVQSVEARTRGPLYFTNAAGTKTLDLFDFNEIDEPTDLAGLVTFPDPTFGGLFPGQTNDTFWTTVDHIANSPGDRVKRECKETVDEFGWYEWNCTRTLPSNPSDLDYLAYYLDWWGDAF